MSIFWIWILQFEYDGWLHFGIYPSSQHTHTQICGRNEHSQLDSDADFNGKW